MQQNFSARIALIAGVLLGALLLIFHAGDLKHPDLKPGIDMVGGTSLLYEIRPPEGMPYMPNLAEKVMEALKKRVDPDGVKNLVWRPQGERRLEIQMPMRVGGEDAKTVRDRYLAVQAEVDGLNVSAGEVQRTIEQKTGPERDAALERLARGSSARASLLKDLAQTYDRLAQLRTAQNDPRAEARTEQQYAAQLKQIDDMNLAVAELQSLMEASKETRERRLGEIRAQNQNYPQRLAAIDGFLKTYAEYQTVKDSIDDAGELKRLLKGSGVLEFHIMVDDYSTPENRALIERLQKKGPRPEAGETVRWFQVDRAKEMGRPTFRYNDKDWALAYVTPEKSMDNRSGKPRWALEGAYKTSNDMGAACVGFRFDVQGSKYFGELTGANVGKALAVMLDDKILTAPNIRQRISRQGIIEAGDKGYTTQELTYLISTLNAGSLPAQLAEEPISERTVSPQLGQDNLIRGLIACGFGLVVVAVFLIGYYYLAGVVATIAVMLNMVLILGTMAALNATFTLAGIAGIVLTIGMAVDANVLIFERLREEQHRGLSIRMALRNAYDRAFSAIFDSNVTTAITALILYWFGSEEVKGFGLTLLIGLVWSLFTALFVTRTIFGILVEKMGLQKLGSLPLTFPKWDKLLRPNIDWMGMAWVFYVFSAVFIGIGLVLFTIKYRQDKILDIEFAGGTAVQFELKPGQEMQLERRGAVDAKEKSGTKALEAASVVAVGKDDRTYEILTPSTNSKAVTDAVLSAFSGKLSLKYPSAFGHSGMQAEDALADRTIIPLEKATTAIPGFVSEDVKTAVARHTGGAAMVLKELTPPISPAEIKSRLDNQRLQPGQATSAYLSYEVLADSPKDQPTQTAVVVVSDPAFPYDLGVENWQGQLVGPMWQMIGNAVSKPATMQRVSNFDSQVAGDAKQSALVALTLSIIVIMAYIWLRFGNLKFGTATVIALLHDTLFTLAAIGAAHYLYEIPGMRQGLLLEPFRLNLTMVAAILTVMGYSMNDTVVVFDRIRENRGKFGVVSRRIINDSINQTLSRTLLTGGTTILTIFVMYIMGGSGIHGFTFALLVGILVGTYSSIAIASPILLIGSSREQEAAMQRQFGGVPRVAKT